MSWCGTFNPNRRQDGVQQEAGLEREVGAEVPRAGEADQVGESGAAGPRWIPDVSCYRPLPAYRNKQGEVKIGRAAAAFGFDTLELPCGRCIGCKLDRARGWSVRIVHEASLFDSNWFATLTYRDEDLPVGGSLDYRDFQLFMKRLRRKLRGDSPGPDGKFSVRFFCAGEYGERRRRPHFHAILFNVRFGDEVKLMNGTARSVLCEALWKKGNVQLDEVNERTAAYVARYTLTKASKECYDDVVDTSTGEVLTRRREMLRMSNRKGIGASWYSMFAGDVFPHDFAVQAEGRRCKVPRYYWNKFRLEADGAQVEEIAHARFLRAQERLGESTPERRAAREEYAVAKYRSSCERKDL